ncbi:MAG: hypothetical protein IID41_09375 [Planctomycetes bacterium]|nr:hypothetical protein [Planctomycetota bacterium]
MAQAVSGQLSAVSYQELAKLFYASGWTQQELADKEGKSQQGIGQHLRLGMFISWFTTTGSKHENLPKNLTERRFRSYWEQTSGTKDTARSLGIAPGRPPRAYLADFAGV